MSAPPDPAIERRVLECCAETAGSGMPMGALVDRLVAEGFELEPVELEIWRLLGLQRLLPLGFVRRELRRPSTTAGAPPVRRSYEFVLVAAETRG